LLTSRLKQAESQEAFLEDQIAGIKRRAMTPFNRRTSIFMRKKSVDCRTVVAAFERILFNVDR